MLKYTLEAMLCCLIMVSAKAYADTASGSFTAPTERINGEVLTQAEIGGYKVYANGEFVFNLPADANSFTYEVSGETTFNVTTLDTDKRESLFSNTVTVNGKSNPKAPTVTITITINNGI